MEEMSNIKGKLIMALIAVIAIVVIAVVGLGKPVVEKYTYGTDKMDMNEYFGIEADSDLAAIVHNCEIVEEKARIRDGRCYFDEATIIAYITEGFFLAEEYNGGNLLFTTATGTWEIPLDSSVYYDEEGAKDFGYNVAFVANDTFYIEANFLKQFAAFSFEIYDKHVMLDGDLGCEEARVVDKDTQIRRRGGIKSEILREVKSGENVYMLEEMEEWSKVMTEDGLIGYIENKRIQGAAMVMHASPEKPNLPEYTTVSYPGTVSLGFHAIGGIGGNDTIWEMTKEAGDAINVIAPTWFSLCDNVGGYRSFGSSDYVATAHDKGLQVWGVLDNFNYASDNGVNIDEIAVLSVTNQRRNLVQTLTAEAISLGLDGINVDFESLDSACGVYYVQFLRELSVACRAAGLVLSIDDYVPFNFNDFYRLDIQGLVADYVIIMGYDEHYHGSGDLGSVASIDYVSNGLDRTLASVPASKVINALPFYTIVWKEEAGGVTDSYLTLNNTAEYLTNTGIKTEWDETTCQNYAKWQSGAATYQVWLEDADSITVKLNVMRAKELGGVAVWRLGYGTSEVWNLISLYAHN